MAAAILRNLFPKQIYVRSAGVRPGVRDPFVDAVMTEIGLDISSHQPKTFEELGDMSFDLIVTLAPEAHHKALDITRSDAVDVEYWPTIDPTLANGSREQILSAYRSVRDQLEAKIKREFGWAASPSG